jgi:hypothetical protein
MQSLSPVKAAEREIFMDVPMGFAEALPISNGSLLERKNYKIFNL